MTYALGRRVEYYDQPIIREIVRNSAEQNYSWSSIILGIVSSPAFKSSMGPMQVAGNEENNDEAETIAATTKL
jgi:hypothetical protein